MDLYKASVLIPKGKDLQDFDDVCVLQSPLGASKRNLSLHIWRLYTSGKCIVRRGKCRAYCSASLYPVSTQKQTSNHLKTADMHPLTKAVSSAHPQCRLLPSNLQWLLANAPVFPVSGSQVRVIEEPSEFYSELVKLSKEAQEKVSMASLYLGTGIHAQDLVAALDQSIRETEGKLKVQILLDYTRGSRGDVNSRTILQPLLKNHPNSCQVSLYHTPNLRGLLRRFIPQRWNEVIGLQHMKLYIFDDNMIISGANLSQDYFTMRQDRYMVFKNCPEITSFFKQLIDIVSKFSLQVHQDNSVSIHKDVQVHPYEGNYEKYIKRMHVAVQQLWESEKQRSYQRLEELNNRLSQQSKTLKSDLQVTESENDTSIEKRSGELYSDSIPDTLVFPTIQMGLFGIKHDSTVTQKVLEEAVIGSKIKLASGYFNLTEDYMSCVLSRSKAFFDILMAHPKANGFLGAKGFAGAIPAAYTRLAYLFFNRVNSSDQQQRIKLFEYEKPKWTFHAKGLWYYHSSQDVGPLLTMMGSPNFGWRSVDRDLESQVVLVTRNKELQETLHREQQRLYRTSQQVSSVTYEDQSRFVPYWVRMVMPIIKVFF